MRELAVIGGPLRAVARCRDRTRRVMAVALGVAWLTAASVGAPAGDAAALDGPASGPITPGVGPGAPNNRPHALRFSTVLNARLFVNNQQVMSGTRVALPGGTTRAQFVVERIQAGQGATVTLVLEDDCGDWSTFVGGGPSAW